MAALQHWKLSPDWAFKAAILLSSVPMGLAYSVVNPILAKMAAELGDAYLVKMVSGVLGIAMIVGAPLSGLLADKLGRRPLLIGSGLLFAGLGVAPFFLDDIVIILATRFGLGIAAVAFSTVGATLVGDHFRPAEQPRWLGAMLASSMISAILAVPIAGLLGDAGWRWPFLLYLSGLPFALMASLGLRQSAPRQSIEAAAEANVRVAPATFFPFQLVLKGLLIGVLMYLVPIYVPFQLSRLGIDKPSTIGFALTLELLIGALVAIQFGRARRHFSSQSLFMFSCGGMAVGVTAFALAPSYHVALASLLLIGLASAWLYPNLLSRTIASVEDGRRGRTVGWVKSSLAVAPALGVAALEPVIVLLGLRSALLMIALLAAVMCISTQRRRITRSGWVSRFTRG